jgi:hypothetical protein
VSDEDVLPHGPEVALRGLKGGVQRLHAANEGLLRGGGGVPISIALSEALYWVAALDESLRKSTNAYRTRRKADPSGEAAGGLVYARNLNTHRLVSPGRMESTMGTPIVQRDPGGAIRVIWGEGGIFAVQMLWRPFEDLPLPDTRFPERQGRNEMYRRAVAGRPLTVPLDAAVDWFTRALNLV